MSIDETIKHAEEVAEKKEKEAKEWHENQVRKCELFPFAEMDYTHENECKEYAEKYSQLAEWLKELKQLREQTTWIPISERPPKEKTAVLISCEDMYLQKLNPCVGWRNGRYWETFTANGYKQILYPTAWMPRPKPYRAESEE